MDKNKMGTEQELYLAPEKRKIENAEEIAKLSLEAEKYPFIIAYDANEKDTILTELKNMGCGEIKHLDFVNCIALSLSMAQLKAVKTLDGVEKVETDYDYKCLTKPINEIDGAAYLAGGNSDPRDADTIKLALFDTGVSGVSSKGFVNFVNDSTEDENGHGTRMAGIISAVVESAQNETVSPSIYSVAIADHRGFAKTSTIMQGIDWAINNGIKIICMSFGDYHKSKLLEHMINRASSCGVVMVAAVGNDGSFEDENRIMYPAAFDTVISVGATNGDVVANYSNAGASADCYACGCQTTIDITGDPVNVIGTSAATAFVAGTILKNWCENPQKTSVEIAKEIKVELALPKSVNTDDMLTTMQENDTISVETKVTSNVSKQNTSLLNDNVSVGHISENYAVQASANNMASAINVPFFSWQSGSISCPCDEVWYKFTTNAAEAHPKGGKGCYAIQTQGSLDTVGYLYDADGNRMDFDDDGGNNMNFMISHQLEYRKTYYVKVKGHGNDTGNFSFKVDYARDDHGNSMDNATLVAGVYYQDKSVNGYLHSYGDVDYYKFVPARDCVMEIYTEGGTNTYGQLYSASGVLLDSDNNSNGNGNFKITAHLKAMEYYYIAVSHNSSTGYGDYTLRFKFVKDCKLKTSNQSVSWINDDPDIRDAIGQKLYSIIFLNEDAAYEYHYQMTKLSVRNEINSLYGAGQEALLTELLCDLIGVTENFVLSTGLGLIVQMINNYPTVYGQVTFENALDEVISRNQGFVRCYNFSYVGHPLEFYPDVDATGYSYYNSNYFYGEPYYRGKFVE